MLKVLQSVVYFLARLLSHLEIRNIEHVPLNGGCLLIGNHLGLVDGPLFMAILPRQDVTGLVAEKYQRIFVLSWLVNKLNGIWINRGTADLGALRAAANFIDQGGLLFIAPEGTRSPTHQLIRGKQGAAFLAAHAGDIPIIPAAVTGTEDALNRLFHFQRPHITITFGKPFRLPPIDRKNRSASLRHNTDILMCHIARLLPAKYRGVYSEHPCLKEIDEETLEYPAI